MYGLLATANSNAFLLSCERVAGKNSQHTQTHRKIMTIRITVSLVAQWQRLLHYLCLLAYLVVVFKCTKVLSNM